MAVPVCQKESGAVLFELLWWECGEETGRSYYLSKQSWGRTVSEGLSNKP